MNNWEQYALVFEEGVESEFFAIQSANRALSIMENVLMKERGQLIFLLGEPGSGKTFLLHHILTNHQEKFKPLYFDFPEQSIERFLEKIIVSLKARPISTDIDGLKEQAIHLFADRRCLIMIDEAQMLSEPMMEFLRVLADSKSFWIVLAMHEEEGRQILRQAHFSSRPHRVIELGDLSRKEVSVFINSSLSHSHDDTLKQFFQKHSKYIHTLSRGNFRFLKKLFFTNFMLLHEAQENGMSQFKDPSICLLNMSAIEIGLIDA